MRDDRKRTLAAIWRTAHGLGALALVALAVAIFMALPVRAQGTTVGSLEPCLDTHFDPARYVADLQAMGWQPVPEATRGPALDRLSDAFLALLVVEFDPAAAETAGLRQAQRADWAARTDGRNLLQREGQTLFIGGDLAPDGRQRVLCWMATGPDDALMSELWAIWTETGHTDQAGAVTRAAIPETPTPTPGATFAFYAVSTPQDAMTPSLAASQGLLTQLIIPPQATPD
ncbi:hypothetical protein N0B44_15015 [Roseibacterium beibuensis]|uniref:Uncharacterized protein n=1 Tax=[Roseibacterium] beibuensis TaxID=1193142 RepID=A0ABP9L914_9RHOB|nr:hypothetical protein [Roseibacterium beibuensis]MCS6624227.1 hypothetical protein [Roseibacterium beibuensis]